jgi:molybdate transport system permease protein
VDREDVSASVLEALAISLKVALCATIAALPIAVLLGRTLARHDFRGRSLVETIVSLPLVLPPTAVGYLLLALLARNGPLGPARLGFDLDLLLTWKGAVLASAIMSLPLMVRTARVAFEEVDARLEAIARTLGLSPARVFARVTLPLARRGLLAAAILGFGRALGEFGATVIVAGNIPGRTQTLALAIFNDIQIGRDRDALTAVGVTAVLAFAVLFAAERLTRHRSEP